MITSCFCAITISQFIPGLYLIVYAATRAGEFVTKRHRRLLPTMFQHYPSGYERLKIGLIAISVAYGTRPPFIPHLEGDTHPDHPADFLAFSLIVYLVVRSKLNKVPIPKLFRTIAQDATLFPVYIHLTSHVLDVSCIRKRECVVVMLFLLPLRPL